MTDLNFDANQHAPQTSLPLLPPGWQPMKITNAELTRTRDNMGSYLELECLIMQGEFANRKVFGRITRENQNQVSVDIGNGQLSALCHAVGVMHPSTTNILGIPFEGKIKVIPPKKDENGNIIYEAKNEVKEFRKLEGAAAQGMSGQPAGGAPEWAGQQSAQQPTAFADPNAFQMQAPPPAGQPAAAPPGQKPEPVMTAKANGLPYQAFIDQGWTDEQLISNGYMEAAQPPASQAPPPAQSPANVNAEPAPAGSNPPSMTAIPDWAKQQ